MPEESNMDLARCAVAEFIGVALFQFFGGLPGAGATGNGLALIVLIYGTASISGGHLNPAVSLALAVTQQITPKKAGIYMLCQLLGGICGAAMVYAINNADDQKIFGTSCTADAMAAAGIVGSAATYGCNSCTLPQMPTSVASGVVDVVTTVAAVAASNGTNATAATTITTPTTVYTTVSSISGGQVSHTHPVRP